MAGKNLRSHLAGLIVGRKHTGKSTYANSVAKDYYESHPGKKVCIIDVNGSPAYGEHKWITEKEFPRWTKGIYRYYNSDHAVMWDTLVKYFKNGLIIFEDCTKYIPANVPPKIKGILVDHRMWEADVLFTFHSFKRIPPFFWEMASMVTILKTQEEIETARNRSLIPNYDAVLTARKKVMAHKSEYFNLTVKTLI
jgi:hypothetical protein